MSGSYPVDVPENRAQMFSDRPAAAERTIISIEEIGEALWSIEEHLDPIDRSWPNLKEREREHYRVLAKAFTEYLLARFVAGDYVVSRHSKKGE